MKETNRTEKTIRFVALVAAFVLSIYAVSNLMPLLLHVVTTGPTLVDAALIAGYLTVGAIAVGILARAIYRLDRRAGRIRNRVRWFE